MAVIARCLLHVVYEFQAFLNLFAKQSLGLSSGMAAQVSHIRHVLQLQFDWTMHCLCHSAVPKRVGSHATLLTIRDALLCGVDHGVASAARGCCWATRCNYSVMPLLGPTSAQPQVRCKRSAWFAGGGWILGGFCDSRAGRRLPVLPRAGRRPPQPDLPAVHLHLWCVFHSGFATLPEVHRNAATTVPMVTAALHGWLALFTLLTATQFQQVAVHSSTLPGTCAHGLLWHGHARAHMPFDSTFAAATLSVLPLLLCSHVRGAAGAGHTCVGHNRAGLRAGRLRIRALLCERAPARPQASRAAVTQWRHDILAARLAQPAKP